MLNRIFPDVIDNRYRGHKLALSSRYEEETIRRNVPPIASAASE